MSRYQPPFMLTAQQQAVIAGVQSARAYKYAQQYAAQGADPHDAVKKAVDASTYEGARWIGVFPYATFVTLFAWAWAESIGTLVVMGAKGGVMFTAALLWIRMRTFVSLPPGKKAQYQVPTGLVIVAFALSLFFVVFGYLWIIYDSVAL